MHKGRADISPARFFGGRKSVLVQAFCPMGKTLMPGQFICPEQIKRNGVPGGACSVGADAPPAAQEKAMMGPQSEPSESGSLWERRSKEAV